MFLRNKNVFRKNKVHVLSQQCATCIFRPGNLMDLEPKRVKDMLAYCVKHDRIIPCHEVMDTKTPAVCRGLFNTQKVAILEMAEHLGFITFQEQEGVMIPQPEIKTIKVHPNAQHWLVRLARYHVPVAAFEHFRTTDPYRELPDGKNTLHIGVAVLSDGRCYAVRVRGSHTKYVQKHWYAMACGRALKRAGYELNHDFTVRTGEDVTPRELRAEVAGHLIGQGWL